MITEALLISACILVLFYLYKSVFVHHWKYSDIPAIPKRWPLVGNLFDMTKTHLVLSDWARKYGPIYRFSLYGEEIVVLNDYASIHEALVTNGSDVAGRPRMSRTDYMDRNKNSIVWQTYTDKLQFLRRQIHSSLRMYGSGLDRLEDSCAEELQQLVERIESFHDQPFNSWDLFYDSACNIMLELAIGIRLPYDGAGLTRLKKINSLFNHTFGPGSSRILDRFPWTTFLNRILGESSWNPIAHAEEYNTLQKAMELRDQFWKDMALYSEIPEHDSGVIADLRRAASLPKYRAYDVTENNLKEAFTNLILAGTDTTSTALTCFLLILLHNPDVQHKLHVEVDHVIGASRSPALTDRNSMPYMKACLLEMLRYISHVPLAVPHATMRDTVVCGKRIPKDTTVYINLWALHHDEMFWKDPWTFRPDRFLDADGDVVPPSHDCRRSLMPFGAGRRVCLGESLAQNRLFFFAVSLLQKFEFRCPDNELLPSLDPRDFRLGIVLHPEEFRVRVIKRNVTGEHIRC